MVSKKTINFIKKHAISIVVGIIILIIGGFINSYFNSSDPVFYLEDSAFHSFNKDKEDTLTLNLFNKGNVQGSAILCASSKEFIFKSNNNNFINKICFSEYKIPPIQTGLMYPYTLTIKPDANIFNSIQNATIRIDVTCSQKIWDISSKNCDGLTRLYNYKKVGDNLNKIMS